MKTDTVIAVHFSSAVIVQHVDLQDETFVWKFFGVPKGEYGKSDTEQLCLIE